MIVCTGEGNCCKISYWWDYWFVRLPWWAYSYIQASRIIASAWTARHIVIKASYFFVLYYLHFLRCTCFLRSQALLFLTEGSIFYVVIVSLAPSCLNTRSATSNSLGVIVSLVVAHNNDSNKRKLDKTGDVRFVYAVILCHVLKWQVLI
jgi:hypothetical protein